MVLLLGRITTEAPKVQGWAFHGAIPEAARKRAKTSGKNGPIEDNHPPTPLTASPESDRSPQLAKNKGYGEHRPVQFECAKRFDDILSLLFGH
jgi:hypothetical protein